MSANTSESEEPVESIDQLIGLLHGAGKPAAARRIGVEHEKLLAHRSGPRAGLAPDHSVIAEVLAELDDDSQPVREGDALIGLTLGRGGTVSLEPGGQLEHSSAPRARLGEALADNDLHLDRLLDVAARHDLVVLGCGFRPFGTLDDVPWMPKGRYAIMREYLPTRGTRGLEMMKRTATVQANFDWQSESEAMAMLRTAFAIGPAVTALFAASPLVDGKPSGFQSYRAYAWLDTDRDRCGVLPFVFDDTASFARYVDWALDVPMFFIRRGGVFHAAGGVTFRQFWQNGALGTRPTLGDWDLHMSTLFPNVRLRSYLEVRQADASTRPMASALPALWMGLLYDESARSAAWERVATWSLAERLALEAAVSEHGLATPIAGETLATVARDLVAIAERGLAAVDGSTVPLLEPLIAIAASGRSHADEIVAAVAAAPDLASRLDRLALT